MTTHQSRTHSPGTTHNSPPLHPSFAPISSSYSLDPHGWFSLILLLLCPLSGILLPNLSVKEGLL